MWIQFNEVQLRTYLDAAIQDFNAVVGIIPAACVIHHMHGYYGYLWSIEQNPRYCASPDHPAKYGWMKMLHAEYIATNEIYLLLYMTSEKAYALKYLIENDAVRRDTELINGVRVPCFQLHEELREYKVQW